MNRVEDEILKLRKEKIEAEQNFKELEKNLKVTLDKMPDDKNLSIDKNDKCGTKEVANPKSMEIERLREQNNTKKVTINNIVCEHHFCKNVSEKLEQMEEKVKIYLNDHNNKISERNINNSKLKDIENSIKGMNIK